MWPRPLPVSNCVFLHFHFGYLLILRRSCSLLIVRWCKSPQVVDSGDCPNEVAVRHICKSRKMRLGAAVLRYLPTSFDPLSGLFKVDVLGCIWYMQVTISTSSNATGKGTCANHTVFNSQFSGYERTGAFDT